MSDNEIIVITGNDVVYYNSNIGRTSKSKIYFDRDGKRYFKRTLTICGRYAGSYRIYIDK